MYFIKVEDDHERAPPEFDRAMAFECPPHPQSSCHQVIQKNIYICLYIIKLKLNLYLTSYFFHYNFYRV